MMMIFFVKNSAKLHYARSDGCRKYQKSKHNRQPALYGECHYAILLFVLKISYILRTKIA